MLDGAIYPDHFPTPDMSSVVAVVTLPRPGVIQPPYQLPALVTVGGVVSAHLRPLVTGAPPTLLHCHCHDQGLHLNGLAQTRGPRARAEHVRYELGLEDVQPAIGQTTDAFQWHQ